MDKDWDEVEMLEDPFLIWKCDVRKLFIEWPRGKLTGGFKTGGFLVVYYFRCPSRDVFLKHLPWLKLFSVLTSDISDKQMMFRLPFVVFKVFFFFFDSVKILWNGSLASFQQNL